MLQKLLFVIKFNVAINTVVLHIQTNLQSREAPVSLIVSIHLFAYISVIPTGRISTKFHIGGLVWKSVEKSKHG
jgi:hypothetical protein